MFRHLTREVLHPATVMFSPGGLEVASTVFQPRFERARAVPGTVGVVAEYDVNHTWLAWYECMSFMMTLLPRPVADPARKAPPLSLQFAFVSHDFTPLFAINHYFGTEHLGLDWDWYFGLLSNANIRLKLRYTGKVLRLDPKYTLFGRIRMLYNRAREHPNIAVFDCAEGEYREAHRACWIQSKTNDSAVFRLTTADFWRYGAWMRAAVPLYRRVLVWYSKYDAGVFVFYIHFRKPLGKTQSAMVEKMDLSPFNEAPEDYPQWCATFDALLDWVKWADTQPVRDVAIKPIDTRLYVSNVLNE